MPHAPPDPVHRVLIILDGLADRASQAAGAAPTPTEGAATPHLDSLARAGQLGQVVVVGPGIAPESDAGVLALLGYDPEHDSPGRGVLEAVGVGCDLRPGDVALRLNFATGDGAGRISDSRVGRALGTADAAELARSLTDADLLRPEEISAEVRSTVGHRGVLVLRPRDGGLLSPEVTNADPFYERVGGLGRARTVSDPRVEPVRALDSQSASQRTAEAVNVFLERARALLAGHRVNARRALAGKKVANELLLRNAGSIRAAGLAPFSDRWGWSGAAVTEMPVERGIARLLGLEDRFVGPMGADRDVGFRERARATAEACRERPFVYVHLKGPDEPGHDGNAEVKREIIEAIDRSFFGPFLEAVDLERLRLAVTADHATPCSLRGHSDDPVPLLLAGAGIPPAPDALTTKFGETAAARGALGTHRGRDVLPILRDGRASE